MSGMLQSSTRQHLLIPKPRYKKTKYNNSEEQMKKYTTLMSAYGVGVGIDFKFHGMVANTLDAHRLIQHFQEEMGPETADKIVTSLYRQYFEEEAHPAAPTTLLKAALDGGVERSEAEAFVGDEYEALPETKLLIREQASNGIEYVVLKTLLPLSYTLSFVKPPKCPYCRHMS